jgi:hypothetical protein
VSQRDTAILHRRPFAGGFRLTGKKRKIMASALAEPISYAQLVSLRNAFGTPENLAESMVDSRLTPSYDEALRKARLIFCSPAEAKTKAKVADAHGQAKADAPATAPKPDAEAKPDTPKSEVQIFANRRDVTPQQMTQTILGYADQMKQGPNKGWQAAKNLIELAVFNKQFGVQAQIVLERIANGPDLLAQKTLLALGSYPYSAEVDQMALQTILARPKIRPALEKWANTIGHPLRQHASRFLTFMGKK